MHPAALSIDDLVARCEFRRQRRSGPGGQHRNKVETGVFVKHVPTNIEAAATEQRSQSRNRDEAIERLRVKLAIEHRVPPTSSGPTELWKSRVRGGKISLSRKHHDFATVLAESLDFLASVDFDFAAAAEHFSCSRSQLVKLLAMEPAALTEVNRWREKQGLSRLKR